MSATVFYVSLAVGALVIAPFARLIPTGRGTMQLPAAIFMALIFAFIGGTFAVELFEAQNATAVLAVLALTPLYLVVVNRSGSDHGWSDWGSNSSSWDSSCGDSGGGGDGGCGGGD